MDLVTRAWAEMLKTVAKPEKQVRSGTADVAFLLSFPLFHGNLTGSQPDGPTSK
jgi:hypothetical protein